MNKVNNCKIMDLNTPFGQAVPTPYIERNMRVSSLWLMLYLEMAEILLFVVMANEGGT